MMLLALVLATVSAYPCVTLDGSVSVPVERELVERPFDIAWDAERSRLFVSADIDQTRRIVALDKSGRQTALWQVPAGYEQASGVFLFRGQTDVVLWDRAAKRFRLCALGKGTIDATAVVAPSLAEIDRQIDGPYRDTGLKLFWGLKWFGPPVIGRDAAGPPDGPDETWLFSLPALAGFRASLSPDLGVAAYAWDYGGQHGLARRTASVWTALPGEETQSFATGRVYAVDCDGARAAYALVGRDGQPQTYRYIWRGSKVETRIEPGQLLARSIRTVPRQGN